MNANPLSQILDERPLAKPDELKTIRRCARQMFWCCIGLFVVACSLAWTNWQTIRNEKALNWENASLRKRLDAEASRRRALDDKVVALTLTIGHLQNVLSKEVSR